MEKKFLVCVYFRYEVYENTIQDSEKLAYAFLEDKLTYYKTKREDDIKQYGIDYVNRNEYLYGYIQTVYC